MHRVSVVGNSGSGKTTVAAELARLIGAPHLELDSVFQQPDWVPLPEPEFRAVGRTWAWTRRRVYRDRFLQAMLGPDYPQLRFIRLTSPAEIREFLAAAGQPQASPAGPPR